jgi:hypothetical protein
VGDLEGLGQDPVEMVPSEMQAEAEAMEVRCRYGCQVGV